MHEFTFILDASADSVDSLAESLFEAGCDDALLGLSNGAVYLDFDRESEQGLAECMLEALRAVESVVSVIRVEPENLVTLSDIAARTNRTRESVRLIVAGQRGDGAFPRPVWGHRKGLKLWRWVEVVAWFVRHVSATQHLKQKHLKQRFMQAAELEIELQRARIIAAFNGCLDIRTNVDDPKIAHTLMDTLVMSSSG